MSDLLAEERRRQIVERIRTTGMARVADLAQALSVAEETVRRDLKMLDQQGVLKRTHGGALPNQANGHSRPQSDLPFQHRREAFLPQKRAIVSEAIGHISPSQTLALDGSTTAWEFAQLLHDPSLTIVTNSLMIIQSLAMRPGPKVISVGGSLDRDLMMFTGMIAEGALRHVQIDLFFCSCGGIDGKRGFSDPSESGAHFKRQLLQLADKTILLADSSKFHSRAPVLFAAPDEIDELITDDQAPNEAVELLQQAGVSCKLAGLRE